MHNGTKLVRDNGARLAWATEALAYLSKHRPTFAKLAIEMGVYKVEPFGGGHLLSAVDEIDAAISDLEVLAAPHDPEQYEDPETAGRR